MRHFAFLLFTAAAAEMTFEAYVAKWQKTYASKEEEDVARRAFAASLALVDRHRAENADAPFELDVMGSPFADLHWPDFRAKVLMTKEQDCSATGAPPAGLWNMTSRILPPAEEGPWRRGTPLLPPRGTYQGNTHITWMALGGAHPAVGSGGGNGAGGGSGGRGAGRFLDHSTGVHPEVFSLAARQGRLPASMDWRDMGIVSEVKDQGHCGSCWTFSTSGAVEAHHAITFGNWKSPRVSEQQLVDCAQAFNNHGCDGGLPSHAFEYIRHAGGLAEEFKYHYEGTDGHCRFSLASNRTIIGAEVPFGAVNISQGDEEAIKYYLATRGPVSIAYEVVDDFRLYKKGVYESKACRATPQAVNHAVLAVGYGEENGVPYWLVKNSWGYLWGDTGYFKIRRGKNMCGVAECASFPNIQGGVFPEQPVAKARTVAPENVVVLA